MADCICGHAKHLHDFSNGGECLATEQGTDCSCMEFRESPNKPPVIAELMCKCGHDIYYHAGGKGACGVSKFDIAECTCNEFRRAAQPTTEKCIKCGHIMIMHHNGGCEVAACNCSGYSPPQTMNQKAQAEAARPRGKCPRCGEDHYLDPLGIATRCIAVQQVSFNSDGGIGYIEFVVGAQPQQEAILVNGMSADTFQQIQRDFIQSLHEKIGKLEKRLERLESRLKAQADEEFCHCGHGLGEHKSGDGCSQCSCRAFSLF